MNCISRNRARIENQLHSPLRPLQSHIANVINIIEAAAVDKANEASEFALFCSPRTEIAKPQEPHTHGENQPKSANKLYRSSSGIVDVMPGGDVVGRS